MDALAATQLVALYKNNPFMQAEQVKLAEYTWQLGISEDWKHELALK